MAHHEFSTPTTYYNTMGSVIRRLFHVEAGDSISTTTVDARGFDHEAGGTSGDGRIRRRVRSM